MDARIIGAVIKRYREKCARSQDVVSGLADIGRTHLSAIECGTRKPTPDTFFKIADALNVEPHKLMKLIEDEVNKQNG